MSKNQDNKLLDVLVESAIGKTQLPESKDCDCRQNLKYDKYSETCRKCHIAGILFETALREAAAAGDIDTFIKLLTSQKGE